MSRNARMLVVMGIAITVAALATYGVVLAIRNQQPEADPVVDVVVAKAQLKTGGCLTEDQLTLLQWPLKYRPAGAFAKIDDAVGRNLITAGVENEPITENKLAPRDAGCGLPPTIDRGMRAMSVRVNEVIGVAGFVTPGTRVDVLVTLRESNDSLSRVVVTNVQVLTAGTRYDEAEATTQGKPIPSTVVTLMVTPSDAERIALAAAEGQIMLALRNPLDADPTKTLGITKGSLMGRSVAPAAPAAVAARPAVRVPGRRVFRNCVSGKCTEEPL